MKRRITACLIFMVLLVSMFAPAGKAQAATTLQYEKFAVSEGEAYSLRNVASGWYMNVQHAGTSNGTKINLYPLDMTEPMTQQFVFRVVDAGKKVVTVSPKPAKNRYLDVRRNGKAFAAGQGICIWEADGDPLKDFVLDVQKDGSFYLCFASYPEYCIGAKNASAASTEQTQLVVRKKENAAELRWFLCDKSGLPLMDVENNLETWDNPYYEKYGQDYIDLFKDNPMYLNNETFFAVTDSYLDAGRRVLDTHRNEAWLGSFMYSLDNGKDILIHEVLAQFGWSKSFREKMRFEAIQNLMKDICNDQNTLDSMMDEVQDKFEILDTVYSLKGEVTEKVYKEKYIKSLADASSIPEGQIKKLVEASSKKGSTVMEAVGNGLEVFDFLTAIVQLYCLEQSMIDCLMENVDPASDMYLDLKLLKENKENNAYQYIKDTLLSEACVQIISKGLSKIVHNGLHVSEMSTLLADVGVSILVNHVYQGALADEIIQTTYLYSYAATLKSTLLNMQVKFKNQSTVVTSEDIVQYELVFSAYLSALKTLAKSAEKMDVKNSYIPSMIDNSKDFWNYDSYIASCLKNAPSVQGKLEELVTKLDGKYFTVNKKACTSPSAYNCGVMNIIKQSWLRDSFLGKGSVSTSQFPKLTVDASGKAQSGYSCFGFANFALWYLYSDGIKDNVTAHTVATGTYNKQFLQENVKAGDALRIMGTNGAHTVVVYSVDETGLTVLDSNFYLDCKVKKHLIKYNHSSFLNRTVYVDRVVD